MDKKNPNRLTYLVSLAITTFLLGLILYINIFSSDAVNARNHVPETGWGVLLMSLLLTPIFIVFAVITYFTRSASKKREIELSNTANTSGLASSTTSQDTVSGDFPSSQTPKIEP